MGNACATPREEKASESWPQHGKCKRELDDPTEPEERRPVPVEDKALAVAASSSPGDPQGCSLGLERRVSGSSTAAEELAAGSPQRHQRLDVERPWMAPDDPLDAEWELVARGVSEQEYGRLQDFRGLVKDRGLDAHEACAVTPHTRRAVTLLRFLRARQGGLEKALSMLSDALDWRRDFEIDRRMREWRSELQEGTSARLRVLMRYRWTCMSTDASGLPVFMQRESVGDPAGLMRELGLDVLLVHFVTEIEDAFELARERMLRTGTLHTSFVEIHDVGSQGLVPNWWQRAFGSIPFYQKLAPVLDKVYPERVRLAFVVRVPRSFNLIWQLFLPLVPPETKKKIRIYGYPAQAFREELIGAIGESAVPAYLLTDDMSVIADALPPGGVVPAGSLAKEEALRKEGRLSVGT